MDYLIYLVEDDFSLNRVLTSCFVSEGWRFVSFTTGEEAIKTIPDKPDLWIIDIMLPGINGYEIIAQIKRLTPQIPVIIISGKDSDTERLTGYELGCDDYITKPFLTKELVIRAEHILKSRYSDEKRAQPKNHNDTFVLAPYKVDLENKTVTDNGKQVKLSLKEYSMLTYFIVNQDRILTRTQLLEDIWGTDYFGSDRVVDDTIRRLREKMPYLELVTHYGLGYKLETQLKTVL